MTYLKEKNRFERDIFPERKLPVIYSLTNDYQIDTIRIFSKFLNERSHYYLFVFLLTYTPIFSNFESRKQKNVSIRDNNIFFMNTLR